MTASGITRFFGACARFMADKNSLTLVVEMTMPDSIPQGYTLWNRPRNAMNMVRQVPVMVSMIQKVSRTISP